jgi:hypothetical protein
MSRPASGFRRVEGLEFDGTSSTMTVGTTVVPTLSFGYGDKLQPEKVRDQGSQKIDALTLGTYETSDGKVKMRKSVFFSDFLPALEQSGFGNTLWNAIFSSDHPEMGGSSDSVFCRFTGIEAASENSNKGLEVEFGLTVVQVFWGDERKSINGLDYTQYQATL